MCYSLQFFSISIDDFPPHACWHQLISLQTHILAEMSPTGLHVPPSVPRPPPSAAPHPSLTDPAEVLQILVARSMLTR